MSEHAETEQSRSPVRDIERSETEEFSRLAWELARRAAFATRSSRDGVSTEAWVTLADGGKVWGNGRTSTDAMRDLAMQLDRWAGC